jgi:hypothetical protein
LMFFDIAYAVDRFVFGVILTNNLEIEVLCGNIPVDK